MGGIGHEIGRKMTTSHETAYIGDDVIELDCKITKTADLEECHGVTRARHETEIEIEEIRIYGFSVKMLPSGLVGKFKEEAAEQLLG